MRHIFATTFLFVLLLAELPAPSAAPQEEADDDDDDGDDGVQSTLKLAEQAGSQIMNGFAGPTAPQKQIQPSVPEVTVPQEEEETSVQDMKQDEEEVSVPAPIVANSGGRRINMDTSLNHFGQHHPTATVSTPGSVNMVSSLHRFGGKHAAATAEQAKEVQASVDAQNAHKAAESAKTAAKVASKVAEHSVHITHHAQSALKDARNALHSARVDTSGLTEGQKKSLKTAEAKLKEATKKAEYGELKTAQYTKAEVKNEKLDKLQKKMENVKKAEKEAKVKAKKEAKEAKLKAQMEAKQKKDAELEAMRKEISDLRNELKTKEGEKKEDDEMLMELQDQIKKMEDEDQKEDKTTKQNHDEMKAEIERLRAEIDDMEDDESKVDQGKVTYTVPEKAPVEKEKVVEKYNVDMEPIGDDSKEKDEDVAEATPVEEKGIDIDTAMPYGDLEPFGREDTAQELTENSIKESDAMVDQLERAEVSEEKRAVFRALTRLRGAAITSFDGVARSQTGNIDEYNKIHKWRETHPLHHLADEESDISKWAFPENAD